MTLRQLDIGMALNCTLPPLDFVLPGLLAASTGLVVANGGTGKTTLALQMATSLAAGLPIAGGIFPHDGRSHKTVLVAAEESAMTLMHRLQAIRDCHAGSASLICADSHLRAPELASRLEQHLSVYPAAGRSVRLLERGERTALLETLVERCLGARLVILDPLRRLHDGIENDSGAMTAVVEVLEYLAEQTGAAVVALHHANKLSSTFGTADQQGAGRGSSALTDGVRWQANLVGMTAEEAKAKGLSDDRRSFVRLEVAKANYMAPFPGIWMRRLAGGVLTRASSFESTGPRAKTGRSGEKRRV